MMFFQVQEARFHKDMNEQGNVFANLLEGPISKMTVLEAAR